MMCVCQFVYEYGYTVLQALNHKRAKFKAKSRAKYACIIKFTNTRSLYISFELHAFTCSCIGDRKDTKILHMCFEELRTFTK